MTRRTSERRYKSATYAGRYLAWPRPDMVEVLEIWEMFGESVVTFAGNARQRRRRVRELRRAGYFVNRGGVSS